VTITSRLGEFDLHLFNEGQHRRLHERLGAHPGVRDGDPGTWFAVWAPNASAVEVIADTNGWMPGSWPLAPVATSGLWEGFAPGTPVGDRYKYRITNRGTGAVFDKADPLALCTEVPPATASVIWDLTYDWGDEDWMAGRGAGQGLTDPISIYEVHLGSWRRSPEGWSLDYRAIAAPLIDHVHACGFTHVELLPVMEHPFSGSWGYQTSGYFAPSRRDEPLESLPIATRGQWWSVMAAIPPLAVTVLAPER
jgi:1,4-alpha-glucan branching enzyme